MSDFDRFQTPYHKLRFPDPQESESDEYASCSGCGKSITETDVTLGEVLDIYGMCVHNDFDCVKKAVEAKTINL